MTSHRRFRLRNYHNLRANKQWNKECKVATPAANLTNHHLDHNSVFEDVIIVGSLASRHLHNKDRNLALDATC
jgi:hypothetical protein